MATHALLMAEKGLWDLHEKRVKVREFRDLLEMKPPAPVPAPVPAPDAAPDAAGGGVGWFPFIRTAAPAPAPGPAPGPAPAR
jgi:hypothetical protein